MRFSTELLGRWVKLISEFLAANIYATLLAIFMLIAALCTIYPFLEPAPPVDPVAFALVDGKIVGVDSAGASVPKVDRRRYPKLPLLVGQHASVHFHELANAVGRFHQLRDRLRTAEYVDEKRWTLVLTNGLVIKLPSTELLQHLYRAMDYVQSPKWAAARIIDVRASSVTVIVLQGWSDGQYTKSTVLLWRGSSSR
jgi:Cell division protein FtsQ